MSLLKKIGIALAKATQVLTGIDPLLPFIAGGKAGPIVQRVEDTLNQIAGIVVTVEGIGTSLQLSGAQKLTAAAPLVAQAIRQSSILAGKKIADEAAFNAGVEQIANGVVGVLNSLHEDGVSLKDAA